LQDETPTENAIAAAKSIVFMMTPKAKGRFGFPKRPLETRIEAD
jgi:hypothetical protein